MNYVGLISDPPEPNSNSLLLRVEGLRWVRGPDYCTAPLRGCCFNGGREINGRLMTAGRTRSNNGVLIQRRPRTLVNQDPSAWMHTHKAALHVKNVSGKKIHTKKQPVRPERHIYSAGALPFHLPVRKFRSHPPSVHPVSSGSKTN